MSTRLLIGVLTIGVAASGANAFVVDCRWSYFDTGSGAFAPVPVTGLDLDPSVQSSVRLRLGFQVTDGSPSDAAGGIIGWNVGTLVASGDCCESMSRTPGRLSPFTFLSAPSSNGDPATDPVPCDTLLTGIDATIGFQTPFWGCDPSGNPLPQPPAVVRGLAPQAFVSVYEITLALTAGLGSASVTASGNIVVASEWRTIGVPLPPECGDPADPSDDVPGSVTYAPRTNDPVPFTCTAMVNCIPSPAGAVFFVLPGLVAARRRR